VASVDFREDTAASENLMQRCAEIYRKLRNTFRFLLGNLHGFDPARDRATGGVGLGLAIAMRAVTLHHGDLRSENAHPGLRVILDLPRLAESPKS